MSLMRFRASMCPRAEYERRARFNSDTYSPTPDEIRRFPSRPKIVQPEHDYIMDHNPTMPSQKGDILKLKPPGYR